MKRLLLAWTIATLLGSCAEQESPPPAADEPAVAPPAAVAAPAPPSAAAARELLVSSPEFSDYEFTRASLTLPMRRAALNEPALEMVRQLERAGWLELTADEVVLTGRAQADPRFIARPSGFLDLVPLASKQLGEVSDVRPNPDGTADADFAWQWLPNEVGAAFDRGPLHDRYAAPQAATATLMWSGDRWTVLSIAARP